jgi:type 1 fimbria pilin
MNNAVDSMIDSTLGRALALALVGFGAANMSMAAGTVTGTVTFNGRVEATPASCSAVGFTGSSAVTMNPPSVAWADFSVSTGGVLVNPSWTPVTLAISCTSAATINFYASDPTAGAPNEESLGMLINSSNTSGNAGIQVYLKLAGDASCNGAPELTNGTRLHFRASPPFVYNLGTATGATLNFCARYYTRATSDAALTKGAVTSRMNYTFAYE